MEFATRHHDLLISGGIDRGEVISQAPFLADTMREVVSAIIEGKKHVDLTTYKKKKGKESTVGKKFILPKIKNLSHKERKHFSKEAFHSALKFRKVDLKKNRIEAACRQIKLVYLSNTPRKAKEIYRDAKMLMGAYFLFRKTDGTVSFLSTFDTLFKNPHTGAFETSDILPTLKLVLQAAEKNQEREYSVLVKKLRIYGRDLLKQYGKLKLGE